jgi:hypothetical protein
VAVVARPGSKMKDRQSDRSAQAGTFRREIMVKLSTPTPTTPKGDLIRLNAIEPTVFEGKQPD